MTNYLPQAATSQGARDRSEGFTLLELMITVVIVAVLAAVALVTYRQHVRSGRLVEAQSFIAAIQARQEAYYQRFGFYCNASHNNTTYYPALGNSHCPGGSSEEPCPKPWSTTAYPAPAGWITLGARPESGQSYFEWLVVASDPNTNHAFGSDGNPALLKIPAQPSSPVAGGVTTPRPWYYIIGRADLNSSGIPCTATTCTIMHATSARVDIIINNQGQ